MVLNFKGNGMPASVFAICNFSQVSDAALLIMDTPEQKEIKTLLNYANGKWQTSDLPPFFNAEDFDQINKMLENVAKPAINEPVNEPHFEPGIEHILLLSNFCS